MAKYLDLNWLNISMHAECIRCKNKIPFQKPGEQLVCTDCGYSSNLSWANIIQKINLTSLMIDGNTRKQVDAEMAVSVFLEKQEQLPCQHCKNFVTLGSDVDIDHVNCDKCGCKLEFHEQEELKGLIFYDTKTVRKEHQTQKVSMVAFNCVSCGAPLTTDSSKSTLLCSFCGTPNAINKTTKIPISQMLVTLRKEKYPRAMAFGNNGWQITHALKEHASTFSEEELNKILLKNKNELSVFHTIHKVLGHTAPEMLYEEIFMQSTNREIIVQTGYKLGKSDKELNERLNVKKSGNSEKKQGFFKKLFG